MKKRKTFEEFWSNSFKGEYVEDGNWQRYELLGREYGCSPKPRDRIEFEEYAYLMCNSIWNHQAKRIAELEAKNKKLLIETQKDIDAITKLNKRARELERQNALYRKTLDEIVNFDSDNMVCGDYEELKEISRETQRMIDE